MSIFQTNAVPPEVRLSAGDVPRRRVDREMTPGRCGNLDYCSIGMQRVVVQVPLNQPFVCPECASPLRPPVRRMNGGRPLMLPLLRVAVLLGGMGASLVVGYVAGRVQHTVGAAVSVAGHNAGAHLDAAKAVLGLSAPAPAPPAAIAAFGTPAPPVVVAEREFPAHVAAVDIAKPASRLAHEARFGQVTVDCVLPGGHIHPACQVTDIRGADPVSAAAVAWLQSLAVQYAPSLRGGARAGVDHRWRVVFEDFSGLPTEARPRP